MDNKIIYGIIGVIIAITGGSVGYVLLSPEQLDAAVTCTSNNVTGIFEKLSSTNVTAYWTVNGTEKSSVCTKGKWIPTREWLKLNNLSETDVVVNPVDESKYTEDNIKIIAAGDKIEVDKSQQISIAGTVYNITYKEKPPVIKCICDKTTGCKISECLS